MKDGIKLRVRSRCNRQNPCDGIVIARSSQQFFYYFGHNRNFIYASDITKIRGIHGIPIFFVGEYWYSSVYNNHMVELNMIIWEFQRWANKNFTGC